MPSLPVYKRVTSSLFALPDPNRHPMLSILCPIPSLFSRFVISFDGGDGSNVRSLVEQAAYKVHVRSFFNWRVVTVMYITYCLNIPNYIWILLKNSTYTSQQVHSAYVTKNNRLILYKENVSYLLWESYRTHKLCWQNSEFLDVTADFIHSYHSALDKYYTFHP